MLKEFKEFIAKGNVIDLAVAVIIGAAFSTIVKSLTDDVIMPLVGYLFGGADFSRYFILLSTPEGYRGSLTDYAALKEAGAAMIGYSTNFAVRGLWAGPYLLDVHGMGADDRALLLMVMAVLGTGGIFVSGYLAGRLGTSFPVVIGFAGTGAVVLLTIGLVPGLALEPLIGLLLVFSSISNFFPAVLEHGRRLFDDRLRGRSLTTINSAVFFGVGLTQLVTGNLIDAFPGEGGAHPEIAYRAMFIYVACVGFLGVGIYARFSRRGRRPHR